MTNPTEAILFDFDGVLADTEPLHWEVWREILLPLGIDLTWPWYEANCIGKSERFMLETLVSLSSNSVTVDELWPRYPLKKEKFRERSLVVPIITDETIDALKSLSSRRIGLVTSSGQTEIEPILKKYQILPLMATCVYGGDVKALKPDPEPYLLAKQRLGAINAIVFEDSESGIASATAAGCEVIRVTHASELPRLVQERFGLANLAQ